MAVGRQLSKDPGAGDDQQKRRIAVLLAQDLTAGGVNYNELIHWTADVDGHYLERWRAAVGEENGPGREQTARALASDLLGREFSASYLRDWIRGLESREPSLDVEARDPYVAAERAADVADRLSARAAVGTRDRLDIRGESFVAGHETPIPGRSTRRAEVRALEREGRLLALEPGGPVDQSLELLSYLNTAPDPVAAATGWSSVESLLSGPGDEDKVVTADRLLSELAASTPRVLPRFSSSGTRVGRGISRA